MFYPRLWASTKFPIVHLSHMTRNKTLLIPTSKYTRRVKMLLCIYLFTIDKFGYMTSCLEFGPLTDLAKIHMGAVMTMRLPLRPSLISSSLHTTHSGNLPTVIMQRRGFPEPTRILSNGTDSINITLSLIISQIITFWTCVGCHRVRVWLSC